MSINYRETFFPSLEVQSYLNHAAIAPIAEPVKQAIHHLLDSYSKAGVKGLGLALKNREQLRANLAKFFAIPNSHIGITQSTTDGLNWLAQSFPWERGDRLILFRGEFPANILPWLQAAESWDLKIDWLELSDLSKPSDRLKLAFEKNPRLVAISWVQFQTGQVMNIDLVLELAKASGTAVAVDSIQGLGPLTWKWKDQVDFIAGGGHKWLLGVEGCGYVCVSPNWVSKFRNVNEGWLGQRNAVDFLLEGSGHLNYLKPYKYEASRTERATFNHLGVAGLCASTSLLLDVGLETVSKRIQAHAKKIRTSLQSKGYEVRQSEGSGIVSFKPTQTAPFKSWMSKLENKGVIAASPDGFIRFSPHFYHSDVEIGQALEVINGIF